MQIEIIPMEYPPCKLRTFSINNKEGDIDEFGYCGTYGEGSCYHIFTPYEIPNHDILKKYEISKGEYREICEKLRDTLRVTNCGWCS